MTVCPALCNSRITPANPDASANAPCTRTIVGVIDVVMLVCPGVVGASRFVIKHDMASAGTPSPVWVRRLRDPGVPFFRVRGFGGGVNHRFGLDGGRDGRHLNR